MNACVGHNRSLRLLFFLFVACLLAAPWLPASETLDLFANQGKLTYFLGSLSCSVIALMLVFGRFRHLRLPLLNPLLLLGSVIAVTTILSPFLVSLRQGFLWISLLLIFACLRLIWNNQTTRHIGYLISLSGFLMALYGLAQRFGLDPIHWVGGRFQVVGTFSNPNFLAAFLMSTALVTFGLLRHDDAAKLSSRITLTGLFLVQMTTLFLTACAGALLCCAIGLLMYWWRFWEVPTRRWFRVSPFFGGTLLTLLLIALYAVFSMTARHYPWENLSRTPWDHLSFVTRILEFHMGFTLFLQHPVAGLGPGASPYLLSSLRPPLGNLLGLANFNDDPHSLALTLLAETGGVGLLAFCSLIAAGFGVHRWHRYRHTPHLSLAEDKPHACLTTSPLTTELPVVFAIPAMSLLLHALFNNTLSILPLALQLLLLSACHQAACLRETQWRRCMNWLRLPWLLIVPLFLVTGWSLEQNHQLESRLLYQGQEAADSGRNAEAEQAFSRVLAANQQSLKGLFGLAIAQERQGRLVQAQDLLGKLDQLSPNVFGVRLHLSRIFLERRQLLEAHRWALLHLQWSQSPMAYELLGRILLMEGRLQEAEEVYREGLFHVPLGREDELRAADRMRLLLGELALDRGEMETARNYLQTLTTDEARSASALFLLGRLNYDAGLTTEALTFFEKARQADPKDARIGNALGYLLCELNRDLPRARTILEAAYQQYKEQSSPRLQDILSVTHSLGMLYARIGESAKARELLTLAFDQTPADWREIKEARSRDLNRYLASLASPTVLPASTSQPLGEP